MPLYIQFHRKILYRLFSLIAILFFFSVFALPSQPSFYSVQPDALMTVIVFLLLFVFYMPHQQLTQMIYSPVSAI
jgi:hypothetical protein